MLYQGFRNIVLLSGFAWQLDDGQWVLRQREPLALALPLIVPDGVRTPERREAIDVVGHLVMQDGRAQLLAKFLDRASATSFPHRLAWNVRGVAPGEPMFDEWQITRYWRDLGNAEVDVAPEVLGTLQGRPHLPNEVVDVLSRDPDTAAWCQGAQTQHRLLNFLLLTGMVGQVRQRFTHADNLYYAVDLHTEAPPAAPIPMRLTREVPAIESTRRQFPSFSPIPVTVTGAFLAKVTPDDSGAVRSVEHYVRLAGVVATDRSDFATIPPWVDTWRKATRPKATAMAGA